MTEESPKVAHLINPPYNTMDQLSCLRAMAADQEQLVIALTGVKAVLETLASAQVALTTPPTQFVQNIYSPEAQSPSELYRSAKSVSGESGPKEVTMKARLTDLVELYRDFRLAVLKGEIPVSEEDSLMMNRIDVAIDETQPSKATSDPIPPPYRAVKGDKEFVTLANGMQAPSYLVAALADLGEVWHMSTIPEARAAVVATIVEAQNKKAATLYPFCGNDDPAIREKASPCILRRDHRGKHKDNDDGVWDA